MTTARGRYWLQDFPLHEFWQEYSHHGRFPMARRNLRFTMRRYVGSAEIDHTFARTYVEEEDLRRFIASVADRLVTIEVGAIYPAIGDAASPAHKPWGVFCKELVLDIDLNDYSALRFCGCGEAHKCCTKCFNLYLRDTAVPVIQSVLQSRGWTNASLNYSGNRGVHVWIFEDSVMYRRYLCFVVSQD